MQAYLANVGSQIHPWDRECGMMLDNKHSGLTKAGFSLFLLCSCPPARLTLQNKYTFVP